MGRSVWTIPTLLWRHHRGSKLFRTITSQNNSLHWNVIVGECRGIWRMSAMNFSCLSILIATGWMAIHDILGTVRGDDAVYNEMLAGNHIVGGILRVRRNFQTPSGTLRMLCVGRGNYGIVFPAPEPMLPGRWRWLRRSFGTWTHEIPGEKIDSTRRGSGSGGGGLSSVERDIK